jgi:hypothetical protein
MGLMLLRLTLGLALAWASPAPAQSRFDGWAAVIIAADWRTSDGRPISAFDNARRDLTAGFLDAGFARENTVDLSLRPDVKPPVTAAQAAEAITAVTARATAGCLLYFTSHGSPAGLVFGPDVTLSPTAMATRVRAWCGDRPTVVVISACYSGVFVDGLAGPNRMIMTAARRDRSSFGCSEEATYPYFDGCLIQALPGAADFAALAQATRACVARREADEGLSPASEPQVWIGPAMQMRLPTLRFNRPSR